MNKMRFWPRKRAGWVLLTLLMLVLVAIPAPLFFFTWMPGTSYGGPLHPLEENELAALSRLREHVTVLAGEIVARDTSHPPDLERAAGFLRGVWRDQGFEVSEQPYRAGPVEVANLEVELPGASIPEEVVIVGAHYDSYLGWPGADDNASGIAALLELSRRFAPASRAAPRRTLRFVAFTNEEPPHFQGDTMGSLVYARRCAERGEEVVAILSLETLGYFDDAPGSQHYPWPLGLFYGDRGDFVAFVGDTSSRDLVHRVIARFRAGQYLPSEGVAAPTSIPGIGWSDHWSFTQVGYPAVMVTDTAPFRNPNYHTERDTPETLDYSRLTRVVAGLEEVLLELVDD